MSLSRLLKSNLMAIGLLVVVSCQTIYGASDPITCSRLFSFEHQAQMSNRKIFDIANSVKDTRLYWQSRGDGEYDLHDFATLIADLPREQKNSLLREIPPDFSGKERTLQILKLGCGDPIAWNQWISDVRMGATHSQRLNVDMILLASLSGSRQKEIINDLTVSFAKLSRKRNDPAHLSPRRAVTYVLLAVVKPYEFFMRNPRHPDQAFIEFIDYMGQLTGEKNFTGNEIVRFLKEVQTGLKLLSVNQEEGVLIYGSLMNGTADKDSDVDFNQNTIKNVSILLYNSVQNTLGKRLPVNNDLPDSYLETRDFASTISPIAVEIRQDQIIFWVNPLHSMPYTSQVLHKMKSIPFSPVP